MKLKQLLEAYAWERGKDGKLPTLSDAVETHQQNQEATSVQEQFTSSDEDLETRFDELERQFKLLYTELLDKGIIDGKA